MIDKYWKENIKICENPEKYFAISPNLSSFKIRNGLDFINVEIRSLDSPVLRIVNFIDSKILEEIQNFNETEFETAKIVQNEGEVASETRTAPSQSFERTTAKMLEKNRERLQEYFNLTTSEIFLVCNFQNFPSKISFFSC